MKKALILLSGGLDSTVMLALAIQAGYTCHAISFDYNQNHRIELEAAKAVSAYYGISHQIIQIDPSPFKNSSLVNAGHVPMHRSIDQMNEEGIPSTYVPARNTIFLAYAMGFVELLGIEAIYFGVNKMDRSSYPDCRPEYLKAFQQLLDVAIQQTDEKPKPKLMTPLAEWNKVDIIRQGQHLEVPLHLTISCYSPSSGQACGQCDACILRHDGFQKASS